ncbi:hypothetical protein KC359_g37 [Hortaea werneckii]|nr:hypothetical protein KC359_g37 [Hortaea werneckii]
MPFFSSLALTACLTPQTAKALCQLFSSHGRVILLTSVPAGTASLSLASSSARAADAHARSNCLQKIGQTRRRRKGAASGHI